MNKYLRLFRFGNCLMGAIGVLIACFIAAGFALGDHAIKVIIGCVLVICFEAGGNALNDYVDYEIDMTAHPDRPIPCGEISRKTAQICGIAGLAVAVILSFLISFETVPLVILCAILMFAYETVLKQRGFVGNLTIAVLTGLIFLFGGSIIGDYSQVWTLALLATLVSIGREIAKDIEDVESDEGSRKTLPMIIGRKKAATLAAAFFVIGPILSFIPLLDNTFGILYCSVIVADIIFIYCATIVFKDAHKAEKLAKVAMFAALISFVLGVI